MQKQDIKVLLIEDNPGDVLLIKEALITSSANASENTRFFIEHTDMLEEGLKILSKKSIDIVLLDLTLPDSNGFETFTKMNNEFPNSTVVVLSGVADENLAMKIVQNGAQDYLVKGMVNDSLIYRSIKYAIERKQIEEKLKSSIREKEILLKEIHHRVKNNLQVISSLLSLQSSHINDKNILQMFKEGQNRVKSIALVHEKLYINSNNLEKIVFKDYIDNLAESLFLSYGMTKKIEFELISDNIYFNIDTAVSCGLIINELISNSLKYAFPNGNVGKILINIKKHENNYILIIKDNGIGLSEKINFSNTKTLGLQLVQTLVEQIEGKITINRDNGTEYILTFNEYNNESIFS